MSDGDPRDWMWSEALQVLARAERLHRQVFKPQLSAQRRIDWEPPADVLETDDALLILAALPGVDPQKVRVVIENGVLVIAGERVLPDELRGAVVHRLELPRGYFERRIDLPPGRYGQVRSLTTNGCLVIHLAKAKATPTGARRAP